MTDPETKRIVDIVYGKKNEAKVLRNVKIGQREFVKKYTLTDEGDIDKYETYFVLAGIDSFDITSDSFKINKAWTKYLTSKTVSFNPTRKVRQRKT